MKPVSSAMQERFKFDEDFLKTASPSQNLAEEAVMTEFLEGEEKRLKTLAEVSFYHYYRDIYKLSSGSHILVFFHFYSIRLPTFVTQPMQLLFHKYLFST